MELRTTYKFLGYDGFGNPVVISTEMYGVVDELGVRIIVETKQVENEPPHAPEYMEAPKESKDLELIDSVS